MDPVGGESEGKVDTLFRMREEAKKREYSAVLRRRQFSIDKMIAKEEKRRQEIGKRLQFEIRRLEAMRRA